MGSDRRSERRKSPRRFRDETRSSPASLVLMMVTGVLLVTAAATAIFGNRYSDATPHERLLGALESVASEQAAHHHENGRFAPRVEQLGVEAPEGVHLIMLHADPWGWEAVARSPEVGLSCTQAGRWSGGEAIRDDPMCYRDGS